MSKKVLLLDFDEDMLYLHEAFLKKATNDFETLSSTSYEESLAYCIEGKVDLAICNDDLGSHQPSGLEFIKEIRDSGIKIPILLVIHSHLERKILALTSGADYCISLSRDEPILFYQELHHIIQKELNRKSDEQFWKNKEDQLSAIYANQDVGVALLNATQYVSEPNDVLSRISGYTKDELQHLTLASLSYSNPFDVEGSITQDELASNGRGTVLKKIIQKEGLPKWIRISYSTDPLQLENPDFYMALVEDISGQQMQKNELTNNERLTTLFLRHITEGYFTLYPNGVIRNANQQWMKSIGISGAEMTGKSIYEYIDSESSYALRAAIASLNKLVLGFSVDVTFKTRGMGSISTIVEGIPLFYETDDVALINCICASGSEVE